MAFVADAVIPSVCGVEAQVTYLYVCYVLGYGLCINDVMVFVLYVLSLVSSSVFAAHFSDLIM